MLCRRVVALGVVLVSVLTAVGVAQDVGISPSSLSWNSVQVGQTSGAKSVTLTNNQQVPLTIASTTVSGDFLQTGNTCPLSPQTLAANASCSMSVAFRPTTSGLRSGVITISDD